MPPPRRALTVGASAVLGWALGAGAREEGPTYRLQEEFEWRGGSVEKRTFQVLEHSQEAELAKRHAWQLAKHANEVRAAREIPEERVLDSVWDRNTYRDWFFNLTHDPAEHACYKGFKSMIETTNRCKGWQRTYPDVGERQVRAGANYTLNATVAGSINMWFEDGMAEDIKPLAITAAEIYSNVYNEELLKPFGESQSWMEHECKTFGSLPFLYTCSNRINVLVRRCGFANAYVSFNDYLSLYPEPANNESPNNFDLNFYFCQETLAGNRNPYGHANTFAHEIAHIIQGGYGYSFNAMTEGGATWLEGALLGLPPRPMVYAWGFQDWNRINAAHFYTNTHNSNSRKAYQIHQMFLTYMMQPGVLGIEGTSAVQNYRFFDSAKKIYGRNNYDYYLARAGQGRPSTFEAIDIDIVSTSNPTADAFLDFRVALTSACIAEAAHRPKEPKYSLPDRLKDKPFWDCTAYHVYWTNTGQLPPANITTEIYYGGAAIYRIAMVHNVDITLPADASPKIRTKVMAAGDTCSNDAQVQELAAGGTVSFASECARDVWVIQVNVDPAGEVLSAAEFVADLQEYTHRSASYCVAPCVGQSWQIRGKEEGLDYPNNFVGGLKTTMFDLLVVEEEQVKLTFAAMWDIEQGDSAGWDGAQIRIHTFGEGGDVATGVQVVRPTINGTTGYTTGPNGESEVRIFKSLFPNEPAQNWEGWYGSSDEFSLSAPRWEDVEVDLESFKGQRVMVELFFASDSSATAKGFFVSNLKVITDSSTVYPFPNSEDGGLQTNFELAVLAKTPPAKGVKDSFSQVPIHSGYPAGTLVDTGLTKMGTATAPWSATWSHAPENSEGDRSREYLGYSYAAPIRGARSHVLRVGQEACQTMLSPFKGTLQKVTFFNLIDKIGFDKVGLTVRKGTAPYEVIHGYEMMTSDSIQVMDEGIHTWNLDGKGAICEQQEFMLCVRIGRTRRLAADGDQEPFFNLALTQALGSGNFTMLLKSQDNMTDVVPAPWGEDWTITIRAEFASKDGHCLNAPVPGGTWDVVVVAFVAGLLLIAGAVGLAVCQGRRAREDDQGTALTEVAAA